jgi:DNA repair exonuclease SbcCD ATPase subunit
MKSFFTAFSLFGIASALNISSDADKNRPVSKVITLLKDMQKQLAKEGEADQEIYDKLACWCTTNDKEKTKAIEEAEQRIADLTASIEENTAKSAQLSTEIKNLEKEVAANQAALDKATALRQKQLAEFNGEEKDLLQSIGALKSAVTVLSKHHPSLLQAESEGLINAAVAVQHVMSRHSDVVEQVATPSQSALLKAFVQAPAYAPQSGEIFGILKNMQETFEANLSASQKEEMENQKAYEDLKAAKEAEIKAGQNQIDTKTDELAATDEKLANDKQDIEDTRNSLSADEKFLMDLKEKCQQTDQEFEARQKTRNEEIAAVGEALNFLSSDDAHDLFTRTFNFVQVSAKDTKKRAQASAVLEKAAKSLNKPQLATIAQSVRLDAFTKVKKAIDDMVTALLKEKEDEIKHRDYCVANFHENEKDTTEAERNKDDLLAKIDELTARIESLAAAIKDLEDQIAEAQVQLKRAGEDREKQNMEFQATVQDQRATVKLLNGALNALKGFYEKKKGTGFIQQPAGPPPPAGFNSYENNAGGGGVIAMITQIINDAKAMEAEAIHDETDAQAAYESFVQETNNSITVKKKDIVSKQGAKSTAEGDKSQAETDLASTETELEQLGNEKADLHKACDFTMKNFDIRQEGRDQEVEALRQAKAILSGANFAS